MAWPRRGELRAFYDRVGSRQDGQCWYEDVATAALAARADFEHASAVFELGPGTGRFAESVLRDRLPGGARWYGVDLSPVMVGLARERLASFGDRVRIDTTDGEPPLARADRAFDRFVANYVFDLLAPRQLEAMLAEAARLLADHGRLCVSGLTHGRGPLERGVASVWSAAHRLRPLAVGGCRPLRLADWLDPCLFHVEARVAVSRYGVPSEAVVARRRARA